jgi:hypothetical protein
MITIGNVIGTLGAAAIIFAYAMLQSSRWEATRLAFSCTNAVGAGFILISLAIEPNLPSIIIESFWLLISLLGILRWFKGRSSNSKN